MPAGAGCTLTETGGFLSELRRRNVFRMAGLYLVGAWLVTQVVGTLLPMFDAPPWIARSVVIVLAIAFVPALVFAWVFELTPQGFKRDADVSPRDSIAPLTARRLDRAIIVVLLVALGYFAVDKFLLAPRRESARIAESTARDAAAANAERAKIAATRPDPVAESVAVLPFVNMSADKENEFFSDGVSEEILNSLARIRAIRVVGRTSSFQFKGRNEDLRTIGRSLGVANLLEGSVRREGQRARITAQLIRASDGIHLWSQTYDRTLEDTLAVQLDIAEQVAGALNVVLDDAQRARMRSAGVENVDAFIHYQKGWTLYVDAHRKPDTDLIEGLREANAEFQKATALEPDFSFAYFAETDLYEHLLLADGRSAAERIDAQRAAMRTLQRAAETSPDAQQRELALAERQMLGDDWHGLPARIEGALREPGCSAPNWMPVFASAFGYGDLIENLGARVNACDPFNSINYNTRAWAARATGHPQRVLAITAERRARGGINGKVDHELVAMAMLGRIDEAKRQLRSIAEPDENDYLAALVVGRLAGEDRDTVRAWQKDADRTRSKLKQWSMADAVEAALYGDRAEANHFASTFDTRPAGGLLLAEMVTYCGCGAPFDLDATPNFKARLAESGLAWPPAEAIRFPPRGQDASIAPAKPQ